MAFLGNPHDGAEEETRRPAWPAPTCGAASRAMRPCRAARIDRSQIDLFDATLAMPKDGALTLRRILRSEQNQYQSRIVTVMRQE